MPYKWEHKPSGKPVWGEGPSDARIMFIGERPGRDEDKAGRPFVGLAGKEFDRYLASIGLHREECYVTNLVKVYEDRDPTKEEVDEWIEYLRVELKEIKPKFIATLGAFATRALLGDITMDMAHGIPHPVSLASSAILPHNIDGCQSSYSSIIVPVFHPAAAFYNPEVGKLVQYDFEQFRNVTKGSVVRCSDDVKPDYCDIQPHNDVVASSDEVAIDTEGWQHNPWGLTFSQSGGEAYCIRRGMGRLNASGHVYLHNSLHDLNVLEALGSPIDEDNFTDTMVLAYLLGCEPQGLKDLAYRFAGMKMKSYDDVLATANRQVALEYLHGLNSIDFGPAEQYCIVVNGELKVKSPHSLNRRIDSILNDCERKGADPRKRWNNVDDHVRIQAEKVAGEMPEATLDDIPLKEAVDYACRDADATLRIAPILKQRVADSGQELVSRIDHSVIPMVNRMQTVGMAVNVEHFKLLASKCDIIMQQKAEEIKALTGSTINPNSSDQVAELLFDSLGLLSMKKTKGGKSGQPKPSTNDKVLTTLVDEHPVVQLIMDYRGAAKVRDSFCYPIPRYAQHDGRIHPNIRITRVSSGRLSATAPNLLAIPVRDELGREVRAGFIPAPGHILATYDLNQVEMRHMAQESGDKLLCQLFRDGTRDVHGETAARMFHVPYERAMADAMHYRYPAKRVGFGVITGITGMGLLDQMRLAQTGVQWDERQCDLLIEDWFRVYPGVQSFMEACKTECRRHNAIRDCWGRLRYLPAIHSPIPRLREEAGRQAHSHAIQAGAQGIIKVAMAKIWQELKELRKEYYVECLLQIYDELIFEMDDDELLHSIMDEMVVRHLTTAHLDYMPDYSIPLKAKGARGANWALLEK